MTRVKNKCKSVLFVMKFNFVSIDIKKPSSTTSASNLNPTTETDEGGFGNLEMTRPAQRPNFASIRNGAAKNIYAR